MFSFGPEKTIRQAQTSQGVVPAVPAPNARQTYVALPTKAPAVAAQNGATVPAILAPNARQKN